MGKIAVVAKIKAKAGKQDELKEELLKLIEPSRADKGCISYDLHQDLDDKTVFIFYENWESRKDLEDHLNQPHLDAFKENAAQFLAGGLDINVLNMLSK